MKNLFDDQVLIVVPQLLLEERTRLQRRLHQLNKSFFEKYLLNYFRIRSIKKRLDQIDGELDLHVELARFPNANIPIEKLFFIKT